MIGDSAQIDYTRVQQVSASGQLSGSCQSPSQRKESPYLSTSNEGTNASVIMGFEEINDDDEAVVRP